MKRVWFALPLVAVGLGGCLNMTSGPNPTCAPALIQGAGPVQICRIGGLVFVEAANDGAVIAASDEPMVVSGSDPAAQPASVPSQKPAPALEDFIDGEPMVITSQSLPDKPKASPVLVPRSRPLQQIVF